MSKQPKLNSKGYVVGVLCPKNHSGNRGYSKAVKGWYECCGCGDFRSAASLRAEQDKVKQPAA